MIPWLRSFQRAWTSFFHNSTHMQSSYCVDRKWHRYVYMKKKCLYKKYKHFQFSIIKEWKALKRDILMKMSGRKLRKLLYAVVLMYISRGAPMVESYYRKVTLFKPVIPINMTLTQGFSCEVAFLQSTPGLLLLQLIMRIFWKIAVVIISIYIVIDEHLLKAHWCRFENLPIYLSSLRIRNFQGIVFIWTQTYSEIFKSALMYL